MQASDVGIQFRFKVILRSRAIPKNSRRSWIISMESLSPEKTSGSGVHSDLVIEGLVAWAEAWV